MNTATIRLDPRATHIRPVGGRLDVDFREVWHYRELLYFLVWRDSKVRYKQTAIGVAWAVLQPLFTMLVFTIFFGKLARMPSNGIPIRSSTTLRCCRGSTSPEPSPLRPVPL